MSVPEWVFDAVFYQIFPDRFANGDPANDPVNVQAWGAPPTIRGFQGGDIRGVQQRLDYLADLGINALYFNPIFLASSNHRYNATDYYQIDPKLGSMADFRAFLNAAHARGIRVILDGVFNHCGRGFFAFNDILENQQDSPYRDWFHILHYPVDAYSAGDATDFIGWWKHKSLPKFNTNHPPVRRYLLDVARYWVEQGIDGWRLDVPNEIDDDAFWAEFRHVVKTANPQAYLLGEIWDIQPRWVGENHFDGLMNYPVRSALLAAINGTITVTSLAEQVERAAQAYPWENVLAMYGLLGSHDVERPATMLKNHLEHLKQAYAFLFAYPGAPAIYYGDEIGMEGGKDPDCRRAFSWDERSWNHDLRQWIQRLIVARKNTPALRRGGMQRAICDESRSVYAFWRTLESEAVLAVFNFGAKAQTINVPVHAQTWHDVLGSGDRQADGGLLTLSLPAAGVIILRAAG